MRSQDAATTRLDNYIVDMLPWAHGHQRRALGDFGTACMAPPMGCHAPLARSVGNHEAAGKRLAHLLHHERLEPCHVAGAHCKNVALARQRPLVPAPTVA